MLDFDFNISVLIPAYNAEPYITESIQSVLKQTLQPAEIIVFDDGSRDDTHAVVATFGKQIRLLGPKRLGFVDARNYLLGQANYPWIAFHDADDIWMLDKLEKQVAWLRANPDQEGCLGLSEQFLQAECTLPPTFRKELLDEPSALPFIQNLLTSRSVFDRVGKFEMQDRPLSSDSDWFARARDAGIKMGVIQEVLFKRRWHDSNFSHEFDFNNSMLDILRRSIRRKK